MTGSEQHPVADVRHRMLVEWNDTRADYPRERCIHQLFEAQARRAPDAIALVYGDRELTYREPTSGPTSWPATCKAWAWAPTCWSGSACTARSS